MYEKLLSNYEIIFEGIPEPIFYGRFYPMGRKEGPHGDELRSLFNFGRGLKRDKDPSEDLYREFEDDYKEDLRKLLNCVMADTRRARRGVVVIPSSNPETTSRATKLVRETLASNPKPFRDLTSKLIRTRPKRAAHQGGDRSIAGNADTLKIEDRDFVNQRDVILVIDDIVTSGNSFRAVARVLRNAGFAGSIINFAFSRTIPSDGAIAYLEANRSDAYTPGVTENRLSEHRSNHPLDGLILDLDQTLIDDPVRKESYEKVLWKDSVRRIDTTPYKVYDGVEEILDLRLPMAILSNRPFGEIEHIVKDTSALRYACNNALRKRPLAKLFSFPTETVGNYTVRHYKPSTKGVDEAKNHLQSVCASATHASEVRIIGIGNTKEDMLAYNNAKVESVLALWGIPDYLKEHASAHWGASRVFESPWDLAGYLGRSAGYCSKAALYDSDSEDRTLAFDYYRLAIKYGDDVKNAAFRLAHSVSDDDPQEAIRLYRLSIGAGDEYASTNNLALLVEDKNPQEAINLFERAIDAGNVKTAARNLALLIIGQEPERAIELLKRAAREGNTKHLADDLKPLIIAGNGNAIILYREFAEGSRDEKLEQLAALFAELPTKAATPLLEAAIENGDEVYATRQLALKVMHEAPERAVTLLERAAKAGNASNLMNDLKPLITSGNLRAIELADNEIVAKEPKKAFELALLTADKNKAVAIRLYERAIDAGDEYASTGNLANLISEEEPERARKLYERAISAGETRYATNNLADLIAHDEPERAKELYEQAISAGDKYYAPRNLALLIIDRDPNRAISLLETAAKNGNKRNLAVDLETVIKNGNTKAIRLYESALIVKDKTKANDLAELIKGRMPERADDLYRLAIAAGDERYATFNLAVLLMESDPDEAARLYERAMKAGNVQGAANNLGILTVAKDVIRARSLFMRAIEAGDEVYATCNLAHTYVCSDPDRAAGLYERSLEHGSETEAELGLSYLLRSKKPERASSLAEQAIAADNIESSFKFLIEVVNACDKETAIDIACYISKSGYYAARETVASLEFGDEYNRETGTIELGRDVETGERIPWLVLGPALDGILLLSKFTIHSMPFLEGGDAATWENSTVRSWLNGPFLEQCFSPKETEAMIPHPDLDDSVFCLSETELERHLHGEMGKAIRKAVDNETNGLVEWWLRPMGGGTLSAPYMDEGGKASWTPAFTKHGVRPACILKMRDRRSRS